MKVKLFASRGRTETQDVTAQVKIYTFYGDVEREKEYVEVMRLSKEKEMVHVANVYFE